MNINQTAVLFNGCNYCNAMINFIIGQDKKESISIRNIVINL